MRKTKFRAWDKQRKQMLFDGDYWSGENRQKGNSSICYPILVTNHGVQWCKKYPHPMPEDAIEFDRMTMEDLELMERTGLKDKNGMDIYEGDILEYMSPHEDEYPEGYGPDRYQVEWRDHGFYAQWTKLRDRGGDGLIDSHKDMKVIGNIYENPELLEAKS